MNFVFDHRSSDSPFVESVWHTYSEGGGSFISSAASHWEMVLTKQKGKVTFSIRGPDTKASPAPIPTDAEFLGSFSNAERSYRNYPRAIWSTAPCI